MVESRAIPRIEERTRKHIVDVAMQPPTLVHPLRDQIQLHSD